MFYHLNFISLFTRESETLGKVAFSPINHSITVPINYSKAARKYFLDTYCFYYLLFICDFAAGQLSRLERRANNANVVGSTPTLARILQKRQKTFFGIMCHCYFVETCTSPVVQWLSRSLNTRKVPGSSPGGTRVFEIHFNKLKVKYDFHVKFQNGTGRLAQSVRASC